MASVGREVCEGKEGGLRSGFSGVRGGVWGVRVVEKAACEPGEIVTFELCDGQRRGTSDGDE